MKRQQQTQFELAQPDFEEDKEGQQFAQDNETLLSLYKKKYNHDPDTGNNGNPLLSFESEEEATQFLQELADKNVRFLALEVDANGQYTGNYHMSYDDGQLTSGRVSPEEVGQLIDNYKNGVKPDLELTGAKPFQGQ